MPKRKDGGFVMLPMQISLPGLFVDAEPGSVVYQAEVDGMKITQSLRVNHLTGEVRFQGYINTPAKTEVSGWVVKFLQLGLLRVPVLILSGPNTCMRATVQANLLAA